MPSSMDGASMGAVEKKRCPHCGQIKPASAFGLRWRSKDVLVSWCVDCRKARQRERYDIYQPHIKAASLELIERGEARTREYRERRANDGSNQV